MVGGTNGWRGHGKLCAPALKADSKPRTPRKFAPVKSAFESLAPGKLASINTESRISAVAFILVSLACDRSALRRCNQFFAYESRISFPLCGDC